MRYMVILVDHMLGYDTQLTALVLYNDHLMCVCAHHAGQECWRELKSKLVPTGVTHSCSEAPSLQVLFLA